MRPTDRSLPTVGLGMKLNTSGYVNVFLATVVFVFLSTELVTWSHKYATTYFNRTCFILIHSYPIEIFLGSCGFRNESSGSIKGGRRFE
jgi:hypothetical protein